MTFSYPQLVFAVVLAAISYFFPALGAILALAFIARTIAFPPDAPQ